MQLNLPWKRDMTVASKKDLYPRAGSILGNSAGDEHDHLPFTIILPPAIPTTSGTDTVLPPIGTAVPMPIISEPLTTSTSSPALGSASTTSPTPAASSTSSLQTPTSSGQGNQGQATAADSTGRGSSKMAGGAVAGIVIAVLSIILVIGILVYRKRAIRRRGRMRRTWLPRPFVVETTTTTVVTDAPNALEKRIGEAAGPSGTNGGPSGPRAIPRVKPPPISLLSLPGLQLLGSAGPDSGLAERANAATALRLSSIPDLADEDQGGLNSFNPLLLSQTYSAPPGSRAHPRALTSIGVVRCIFEPSMPDELKIRVGEAMRVLAEYDDGWGLCENLRGERGVVPLQCLDRGMGEEGASASSRPPSGRRMAAGL
ncbi:hypothetical protein APHAL10511_000905 [Amanita phalloides]|nr:hypothetical protein APHAL10511_000905 [Amanita phalloides]